MPSPSRFFNAYHIFSFCLSFIGAAFWLICFLNRAYADRFFEMKIDDITLLLMLFGCALLFIHSLIISLILLFKNGDYKYWGFFAHLILLSCVALIIEETVFGSRDLFIKLDKYCAHKTPEKALSQIRKIQYRNNNSGFEVDECINTAIAHGRIDVLEFLESNNIPVTNNEKAWREAIDKITENLGNELNNREYEMLLWLKNRGERYQYKIDPVNVFFGPRFCNINWSIPLQNFADSLISMGANINSHPETAHPALGFCSRLERLEHVKFLITRGISVAHDKHASLYSPLGEAINNRNLDLIKLLIDAGARPGFNECEDEIQNMCVGLTDPDHAKVTNEILPLFKKANFRIAKESSYYKNHCNNSNISPIVARCLKDFE